MSQWLKQAIAEARKRAQAIPEERRRMILAKYAPSPRPPQGYGHNWLFPGR